MARIDTISVAGTPMRVCVNAPEQPGSHPLVVLMCHIGGIDAFTEDRIDRLAKAGYVAVAPDIFHHYAWIEDSNERRASLRDSRVVADIKAAIAHAESAGAVDSSRIGIVGHCMGGRTALLGAGSDARISALAMYYGGRTMLSWGDEGATPFDLIPNLRGPVIGFFGQDDEEPAPADVDKIEAEINRHGIACEFHRYEGAGHAFQNFLSEERHRPQAAEDSWEKTLDFLAKHFG